MKGTITLNPQQIEVAIRNYVSKHAKETTLGKIHFVIKEDYEDRPGGSKVTTFGGAEIEVEFGRKDSVSIEDLK